MAKPYQLFAATLTVLGLFATHCKGQYVPGRFYMATNGGFVYEWDQDLNRRLKFRLPGIGFTSGSVFNDRDNLVMLAHEGSNTHVIEVSSTGSIVRDYDTHRSGLYRGSYVDFDAATRCYVFADQETITVLGPSLTFIRSSTAFGRASGVAFAPNGIILATDQFNPNVRRFDPTDMHEIFPPIADNSWCLSGMEVTSTGDIWSTSFGDGLVERRSWGVTTPVTVVSGLGFAGVSDIRVLPDGKFITTDQYGFLTLRTSNGTVLRTADWTGHYADGIAFYVPSVPSTIPWIGLLYLGISRRRTVAAISS